MIGGKPLPLPRTICYLISFSKIPLFKKNGWKTKFVCRRISRRLFSVPKYVVLVKNLSSVFQISH